MHADVLRSLETLLDDGTLDLDAVQVVANGGGLGLLLAGTEFGDRIGALQERGVVFKASANTSSRSDLSAEDPVEGVGIGSSGVGEIARLQSGGYACLRPRDPQSEVGLVHPGGELPARSLATRRAGLGTSGSDAIPRWSPFGRRSLDGRPRRAPRSLSDHGRDWPRNRT